MIYCDLQHRRRLMLDNLLQNSKPYTVRMSSTIPQRKLGSSGLEVGAIG